MTDVTETQERQSPYQLVFGAESMDDRLFPPIAEEAEARDQPLDDPDRFLFLSSVGKLLQAIAEPGAPEGGESREVAEGAGVMHEVQADADVEPGPPAEHDVVARPAATRPEAMPPERAGDPGIRDAATRAGAAESAEGSRVAGDATSGDAAVADATPDEAGAEDDSIRQYGRLLYHAFHYWRDQKPTRRVSEKDVRWLLDEVTSVGGWTLTVPASSGYLQLPRNLIWAEPAPGLTPEPVDGFFWRYTAPEGEPSQLHVLLILGVRPDRAGFSVVPATGVLDDEAHWAELDARPDGTDFETNLPGGEMDELYSITTPAEVLKLASLCFWKLDPAAG